MDRKKMLLIFGGAWISAALLTWFLYSSTRAPKVEKTVAVQAAARDLPSGTRLAESDLKVLHIPETAAPKGAIADAKAVVNRALLFPVGANEPLTLAKVSSASGAEGLPASIDIGKRAISVPITDTSGVSGLIQPRAHVDVLFTKPGSTAEAVTSTILEDVVILAVGRVTEGTSSATAPVVSTAAARTAQSATLLVTPEQTRILELAKNQGKISLALRNPLDQTTAGNNNVTTSAALFHTPPAKRIATPPPAPPRPVVVEKPVVEKTGKTVQVFRGDKHSQETFQ